jgi:hypothetical protein
MVSDGADRLQAWISRLPSCLKDAKSSFQNGSHFLSFLHRLEQSSRRKELSIMSDSISATNEAQTCPAVGYQSASICVPVTVTPFANAEATTTKCCGGPVVTLGKNTCGGTKNGTCLFTISQDICISVPVSFGAIAEVGDTYVTCNGASADDICTDCSATIVELPDQGETELQLPCQQRKNSQINENI